MSNIDRVMEIAYSQIGVEEDATGRVKYSDEYGLPRQPWCMMFLWWCYLKAGLSDIFYGGNKTASCGALYRWALREGYVVDKGKRGDIVIWSFRKTKDGSRETSHCGLVSTCNASTTTSVEGNTCKIGSQDNGGKVMEQTRNNKYVLAYIRLPYPDSGVDDYITYTVKKGDSLWKISKQFYGTGLKWKKIYDDNQLTSTTLHVNQLLYIRKE